jgi:hypothetical protein
MRLLVAATPGWENPSIEQPKADRASISAITRGSPNPGNDPPILRLCRADPFYWQFPALPRRPESRSPATQHPNAQHRSTPILHYPNSPIPRS